MARVSVDPLLCDGTRACVWACPQGVFALRVVASNLPLLVKWRTARHGGVQAAVVNEEACTACGMCLAACPEGAVTLGALSLGAPASHRRDAVK